MENQDEREVAWLLQEKYGGEKSAAFFADCERLAGGEPLAYLIGHTPFLDTTIYLDEQPLIPRPETEWWVEKAIAEIKTSLPLPAPTHSEDLAQADFARSSTPAGKSVEQSTSPAGRRRCVSEESAGAGEGVFDPSTVRSVHVLDLCAGSGAIGVAVAKAVSEARVDFCEIDARLLPTIKKNCKANNIAPDRYRIFQSDLFADLGDTLYDIILTNPPYIDPALDRTTESVKKFEPSRALYGGVGGMEIIERIIAEARAKLAPPTPHTHGGQLWIEHEPEQSNAIAALADTHGFTATTHTDQYDVQRYTILMLK